MITEDTPIPRALNNVIRIDDDRIDAAQVSPFNEIEVARSTPVGA